MKNYTIAVNTTEQDFVNFEDAENPEAAFLASYSGHECKNISQLMEALSQDYGDIKVFVFETNTSQLTLAKRCEDRRGMYDQNEALTS